MNLLHRTQKGAQGAPDIAVIEIELDGDDMYKLYKGDMPVLETKNAGGSVVQQVTVKAKHVGASR